MATSRRPVGVLQSVLSRADSRAFPDGTARDPTDPPEMGAARVPRYAVAFRVGSDPPAAGALAVNEETLLLEGRTAEQRVELSVRYADVREVRIGRRPEERLNGYATVLLTTADGPTIQVEPLGAGLLHELADLLAALASDIPSATDEPEIEEKVVVTVPLRKGRIGQVRELIAQGPPFDPAELGLTRHEVFLSDDEAVFVFEGPTARSTLERATRDPSLWRIWLAWRQCVRGRPRLASDFGHDRLSSKQRVYSWRE